MTDTNAAEHDVPESARMTRKSTSPSLIDVRTFLDGRGSLSVIEESQMGFPVRRFYYLHDMKKDVIRGEHAHKTLTQVMICFCGSASVNFYDGKDDFHFKLTKPQDGLYVPPGLWREIIPLEDGTVMGVLASEIYDPDDYIHSRDDYQAYVDSGERDRNLPRG